MAGDSEISSVVVPVTEIENTTLKAALLRENQAHLHRDECEVLMGHTQQGISRGAVGHESEAQARS